MSVEDLADYRTGKNTQHTLLGMFRQAVYGRLAGYEDVNVADRLRLDPAMRTVLGERAVEKSGASTSEMGRFETEILSQRENVLSIINLPGIFVERTHEYKTITELVLDMDSSLSETHGWMMYCNINGFCHRYRQTTQKRHILAIISKISHVGNRQGKMELNVGNYMRFAGLLGNFEWRPQPDLNRCYRL